MMKERPKCDCCKDKVAIVVTGQGMLCGECLNKAMPPINLARSKLG